MTTNYDVIVIGAGAAGLMCAAEAGKRGKRVWLIDHATKIAEKIRISGGGRCNFTNVHTSPKNFLSQNPEFCRSALSRYTPKDFIALMEKHGIAWHEKKLGQLFCDKSSQQIIDMLVSECTGNGVKLEMDTKIFSIEKNENFVVKTSRGDFTSNSLVIATGGLSIPKIGATPFGYEVAKQFGLKIVPTRAALVPLTFDDTLLLRCKELTGLSVEADVRHKKIKFSEGMLFTHRGISGPSILQISSYWKEGEDIVIDLAPETDAFKFLKNKKQDSSKQEIQTALSEILPKRLAQSICNDLHYEGRLADQPDKKLLMLADHINRWIVKPSGSEGYRTAEVTLGGVNANELSSKTMETKSCPGLFFIGEVVDVTGHLGGFNFQWAWASGHAAGQYV